MDFLRKEHGRSEDDGSSAPTVEFKDGSFGPKGTQRARSVLGKGRNQRLSNPRLNIIAGGRSWPGGENSGYSWYDCDFNSLFRAIDDCAGYRKGTGNQDSGDVDFQGRLILIFGGEFDGVKTQCLSPWSTLSNIRLFLNGQRYVPILMRRNFVYVAFVLDTINLDITIPGQFLYEPNEYEQDYGEPEDEDDTYDEGY